MSDVPAPRLSAMLESLAAVQAMVPPAPESIDTVVAQDVPVAPDPMTEAEMFSRFRTDMRAAGLAVYDAIEDMLGIAYSGPAVNVRDPVQATGATHLTLATHGLAPNLWRLYPVLSPLSL